MGAVDRSRGLAPRRLLPAPLGALRAHDLPGARAMVEMTGERRGVTRRALYSRDAAGPDGYGAYRFLLEIVWSRDNARRMLSIGLNPSTANHWKNDPTLTRDCRFAGEMGFGGLIKVNL